MIPSFKTFNGKRIEMFILPNTQHFKIKFVPGGELPEELSGLFTSIRDASNAILCYLDKDSPKLKQKKYGKNSI